MVVLGGVGQKAGAMDRNRTRRQIGWLLSLVAVADLIVIGSRGLGAAKNLLIGSVAYKVIHLSPISVLVAR